MRRLWAEDQAFLTRRAHEQGGLPAGAPTTVNVGDPSLQAHWAQLKAGVRTVALVTAMDRPLGVYSTFLPAREAQLVVNGEAASGQVVQQERFGRPGSSCCAAASRATGPALPSPISPRPRSAPCCRR